MVEPINFTVGLIEAETTVREYLHYHVAMVVIREKIVDSDVCLSKVLGNLSQSMIKSDMLFRCNGRTINSCLQHAGAYTLISSEL